MKKSYKIVFIGSLLPYGCVLIYAVYSAINGIEYSFMMTREIIYGFNGFVHALFVAFMWNLMFFPLLPICFTYQLTFLLFRKAENKKPIWIITLAIAVVMCLRAARFIWNIFS